MTEAYMECGKCGETYSVGKEHECGSRPDIDPTNAELKIQLNFIASVLADQNNRIETLEKHYGSNS